MLKKKVIFAAGLCAVVGAVGIGMYIKARPEEANVVTKETKVEYGNLVVGITESGSVTLGTVEQTLDVELSDSNTISSASSESSLQTGGGNGMGSQMGTGNMGGTSSSGQLAATSSLTSTSSSDATLEVQKVYVSDGQVVEKGTPLVKFIKESVEEVEQQLKKFVESKQLSLKSAKIEQKTQKIDAEYTYKENIAKGKSAKSDYNATLASLQSSVDEAQDAVDEAKERMEEISKEIKTLQNKKKTQSNSSSATVTGSPKQ